MLASVARLLRGLVILVTISAVIAAAAWSRSRWLPWFGATAATQAAHSDDHEHDAPHEKLPAVELSPQARANMKLVTGPAKLSTYWRSIVVPGEIVDRPGVSDRGVTSPAEGIVAQIHAFPGDTVKPGEKLFTLRLVSEYVHDTQSDLFKVTREIELETEKRQRLAQIGEGVIPQVRIIEVDQQLRRLQAELATHRHDLSARGLSAEQIAGVERGTFVTTVDVFAPAAGPTNRRIATPLTANPTDTLLEVQELEVDLGTQVQAGQLLGILSDHRTLSIAGHAFKREAPAIELAAREQWPVRVEFAEDDADAWPQEEQTFAIHHLANSIDPASRTFEFFVPIANQSRSYSTNGQTFVVWRFRPGQRVRIHVPVERLDNVIVVPAAAVVRNGPEAYVFRQKVGHFERRPVRVLYEDRLDVVIANDGSVAPGWSIAQGSAATLNRVLEAQAESGMPAGMHVHADGSVHQSH
jgi:multidrug efflux pump subunit AcrA (membrane-fusion protein)